MDEVKLTTKPDNEGDHLLFVKLTSGKEITILIPHDLERGKYGRPYGLNLVTGGHYY